MNNEELAYVSSSPLLDTAPVEISSVDEDNIDTLGSLRLLKNVKIFIRRLGALEENLTTLQIKEQLAVNSE